MNIRKCRKVLPNVCILGDVPCELMTYGTLEQAEEYVTKLLDDIGWCVIIATGCDIPSEAKPENVLVMSEAAHSYLKIHLQNKLRIPSCLKFIISRHTFRVGQIKTEVFL